MILYIANKNYSSWSLRPWVLMTQLGISFEERLVPFGSAEQNRAAFGRFSPTAKVPCLIDGATTVWDSLAIAEYLAEHHPGVWPADRQARAWARCACAEMHSGFGALRSICSMNCGVRVRLHGGSDALTADQQRLDALWREGLDRFGGPFLAGAAFTAVDAFFAPVAFRALTYAIPFSDRSQAYLERLLALDPMKHWYDAALAETWRDESHDEDIARVGTLTADLRAKAG